MGFFELTKTPWDVLFRDFFRDVDTFSSLETRIGQPVDVYETEDGLNIDIACVGVEKKDVKVLVEGDVLRVSYEKKAKDTTNGKEYSYRGISRGSFDLGWKIAKRFNLEEIKVSLEKGILGIRIPKTSDKEMNVRTIEIR